MKKTIWLLGCLAMASIGIGAVLAYGGWSVGSSPSGPVFGLSKTLGLYRCGGGEIDVTVDYPILGREENFGLDFAPRYDLNYVEGTTRVALQQWTSSELPMDYLFWAESRPTEYQIFEHLKLDAAYMVFGDERNKSQMRRMSIEIARSQTSEERYQKIAGCVSQNVTQINDLLRTIGAPIASIEYIGEELPATREFTCSDPMHTTIIVSGGVWVSSKEARHLVGYISDQIRFVPFDPSDIADELQYAGPAVKRYNEGRVEAIPLATEDVQAAVEAQKLFEVSMRSLLPTCRESEGHIFTDLYPFAPGI